MAIAIAEDDLFCYFMKYHPYYGGKNRKHSKGSDSQTLVYLKDSDGPTTPAKKGLLKRISEWLEDVLDNLDTSESSENSSQSLDEETIEDTNPSKVKDIVIAIAPGHSPKSPENFLHEIVGDLIGGNIKDGRDLLKRTTKVSKAAHGGPRDQSLHEETIKVTDRSKVKDKVVYIIDDVWTSGSTLRACASLMRKAGASDVKLLAVGKTVSM